MSTPNLTSGLGAAEIRMLGIALGSAKAAIKKAR
jgi:hypothetical protein